MSGPVLAGRVWPAVRPSAALRRWRLAGVLGLLAALAGCGHANAPCPTPSSVLDAHRVESEALQGDLSRASDDASALESRREEAARRIQAAKATEDSLAQRASKSPAPARKAKP